MRNTMKYLAAMVTTGMMASVVLADDLPLDWRGQPGSSLQQWSFTTAANPAAPDVAVGAGSEAPAAVTVGEFSIGWQAQLPALGEVSGVWDLGREGSIRVPLPALVASAGAQDRFVLVRVSQYVDGGIYPDNAAVNVSGATYVGDALDLGSEGTVGGWIEDQQLWRVPAGEAAAEVVVIGAYNGSVVDRVVVETGEAVVVPLRVNIQVLPGSPSQVAVSWTGQAGAYKLQTSTSLESGATWEEVTTAEEVTGTTCTVRVNVADAARFFRLVKP